MDIRKPCRAGAVPGSRLWGYDYGRYPIHHFKHNSVPANYLPLAVVACGDDEWHRECYRQRLFGPSRRAGTRFYLSAYRDSLPW